MLHLYIHLNCIQYVQERKFNKQIEIERSLGSKIEEIVYKMEPVIHHTCKLPENR